MANNNIFHAVEDILQGLSVRKAAKKWCIPRSTLHDRVIGKVVNCKAGRKQILSPAEESRFAAWLIERSRLGFGVSKEEFLDAVKSFVTKTDRKTIFKQNRPGNKWYRGFLKRNPQVKLRAARPLDKKRAKITPGDLDKWFADYEKFMHQVGLSNRPCQIWNCDETGFDLQGRAGKVMGPSEDKDQPYRVVTGTKEHITVLPCFNAIGQCIPPYILYAGKRAPNNYNPLEGGVPGSVFSLTEKGYMTAETFYMWLANHFIPNIPPARPVVLLFDSAECHIDLETFELAKKNHVYLYALLKNATHLNQPADVGVFGAMKQSWYKNVRKFSQQNPNTDISKRNFCYVFKDTWDEVMRPSLLIDAFKKSGIYPIKREQISNDKVKTSAVYEQQQNTPRTPPSDIAQQAKPYTESQLDVALSLLSTFKETPFPGAAHAEERAVPSNSTLEAFESNLKTPVKEKYRRRIEEGYDLPGSPTFKAWKSLYTLSGPIKPQNIQPQDRPMEVIAMQHDFSDKSSLAFDEILSYPSQPSTGNTKERKKSAKKTIPNFLNSEASMAILRDEKLKKAREVAVKQQKLKEKVEMRENRKKEQEEKKR
ncbi:uncharacterized protein LOC116288350, partial [Actinia tenebrosa]|uniref:Uncharacterized protein LOC116288350 n=1 Tax=Actinia tenebrosa TaxID=6105 RepID=A0A6P8H3N3_ACTTE